MDKGYVQNTIFELLSRLGIGYEKLEHSPIPVGGINLVHT